MIKSNYKRIILFSLIGLSSATCSAEPVEVGSTSYTTKTLKFGSGQPTVLVCDFNADDHQDLIIANYLDNNIIAHQGDGNGGLLEIGRYSVGERPTGMDAADINNDGNLDLAIANHETSYVTLLFGDGKGSFKQQSESKLNLNIKPHPHAVRLSDLDGDKQVDLIVDSRTDEGLLVFKGLADGRFQTPGKVIHVAGDPYRGFAVNDLNDDGFLDLVTPNQREVGVAINKGTGDMSFSISHIPQTESPFAVAVAEMTGDGKSDLIVATNGRLITVVPGDGQGNFLASKKTEIVASTGAKQISVGDINGDGIIDALVSNWTGELIAIWGSKASLEFSRFKHPSLANPWSVAISDFNEDGKNDFIVADGDSELAVVYISQQSSQENLDKKTNQ